jgi:putative NIF3 family GTP cyclohydrolase 1 type 2
MKTKSTIFSFLIITVLSFPLTGQNLVIGTKASATRIIDVIIENTCVAPIPNTVDIIKEGDPNTLVTGIVTSMFPTMEVLKEAVNKKCNLIIVHEPLYYNHRDETEQLQNDSVFLKKQHYIRDHKLVIWRFHDYMHAMRPDLILLGMYAKFDWENYAVNGNLDQFIFPEMTLRNLLEMLKRKFPKNAFYVIGDPEMKLTNVRFSPGAPVSMYHIGLLEDKKVDVVIAGESRQWETYEYMRDAVSQGRKKAIIFLGHSASEEAGMDYCAGWLKSFIKDIPIYFVESGPSYWSY